MKKQQMGRRIAAAIAGLGITAGAVAGAAVPAQAYSPDPKTKVYQVSTSKAWSHSDVIDGTYFHKDKGGKGIKIELRKDGDYLGKIEFHPYDEVLYFYDNKNDDDTYYVRFGYYERSIKDYIYTNYTPGDHKMKRYNRDLPEGRSVVVSVYDDKQMKDHIVSASGIS